MKAYGYARVSSSGQATNGHSLEIQEQQLREAGAQIVYKETYTGTEADRPKLKHLLARLRAGDVLYVTKLDRFARSAEDGIRLIRELLARGVVIHILNMGRIDDTPMGRMMVTMLLAFAQFERDMIVERMAEGRRRAMESNPNYQNGRPRLKATEAFERQVALVRSKQTTVTAACKALNISRSGWYSLVSRMQ